MKFIRVASEAGVSTIWLNRPEIRNAFHPQMIAELTKTFRQLGRDKQTRVVVLRGEGKSFCAGADLEWMKAMAKYSKQQNIKDSDQLFEMFACAGSCPKPVIGLVHGHVMGGGVGLAAICDFVCAESATQFCFSEVKLGLVPAVISSFVLRKMAFPKALQAMLTADVFTAQKALEWGLASFVGTQLEMEAESQRLITSLLRNGPQAVMATKQLLSHVSSGKSLVRKKSVQTIAECRVSAEGQEGLQSFFSQRKPKWVP